MPVGGGKFRLEKTWRTSGAGSQTFNTSGNYPIPYGKNRIIVSGKGGDGNSAIPSSISTYNPSTPGNPVYNSPSGGNAVFNPFFPSSAFYNPYYPSTAFYNPYYPRTPNYNTYFPSTAFYNPYYPGNDVYNPVSGGNVAGYNPGTPGTAIYNAAGPATAYSYLEFTCEPTFPSGFTVERYAWTEYGGALYNPDNNYPKSQFAVYYSSTCPAPYTIFNSYYSPGGSYAGTNPAEPGNANYNPPSGGNYAYTNAGSGGNFAGYNAASGGNLSGYNAASGGNFAGYNAASGGNFAGYNAASGGNFAGYNTVVPGNYAGTNFVAGTANYNAAVAAAAGASVNVLGVTLPGGAVGAAAPVISGVAVDPYSYPDGSTYPITVVPGGYVTITSE